MDPELADLADRLVQIINDVIAKKELDWTNVIGFVVDAAKYGFDRFVRPQPIGVGAVPATLEEVRDYLIEVRDTNRGAVSATPEKGVPPAVIAFLIKQGLKLLLEYLKNRK